MPEYPISVVIPAYNEESNIAAALESLVHQNTSKPFEVVLVNNASTDRTRTIAEQFVGKLNLTIIDEPTKGRGSARATGFSRATGDIIFSLDADSIAPPNWISSFLPYFSDPDVVAITGVGKINDLSGIENMTFNIIQPLATFLAKFFLGTRWLAGFNFAIRKKAYIQAGGFNRTLNLYEDFELGLAVQKTGEIKLAWSPKVTVSGRRFNKNGFLAGIWEYVISYLQYKNNPETAFLDDPR